MAHRLFTAVSVPVSPTLRKALGQLHRMAKRVRSVDPGGLHTTLRFLGDVDEAALPGLIAAMRRVFSRLPPHTLHCRDVGWFSRGVRGAVIWAGLSGTDRLAAATVSMNGILEASGFDSVRRPWVPHVTLARIRGSAPAGLLAFLEAWKEADFEAFKVDAVRLVRSELTPAGAVHEDVAIVPLAQDPSQRACF